MATNEVRIKNEPIHYSQSILVSKSSNKQQNKNRSNDVQLIKHERESKQINEIKRTRESISSDDNPNNEQPNKRRRQSIVATRIKEEPIEIEIQTSKSQMELKPKKKNSPIKHRFKLFRLLF